MKSSVDYYLTQLGSIRRVSFVSSPLLLVLVAGYYIHSGADGKLAKSKVITNEENSPKSSASFSTQAGLEKTSGKNLTSGTIPANGSPVESEESSRKKELKAQMDVSIANFMAKFVDDNTPIKNPELSADEEREVASCLERVEAEFRRMEQANTKILGEIDGDEGMEVVSMTTVATPDQYSECVDVLGSATEGLSAFVKDVTYARRKRLLDTYVSFPAPFKVVEGFFPYDTDGKTGKPKLNVTFSERYAFKEDAVSFSEDGWVHFSGEGKLGRAFGADGGVPRYGYLFEKYLPAKIAGSIQK